MIIRDWLANAPNRTEAEWVLAHTLGLRRFEIPLGDPVPEAAFALAERLAAGEPLQYVLGDTDFRGLILACDPRALIPRPETEELVELALAQIPNTPGFHVVDVGTGTGCIALAIQSERPHAHVTGIDASPDALDLARTNAARCQLDVTFQLGDLLPHHPEADLVISNLPYIHSHELPNLDANVRDHEPHAALDGGPDGLDLIRRLIPQAASALPSGGWIFLEFGETQGPAVADLLHGAGFQQVEIKTDFAGLDRFGIGVRP